MEKLPTVESFLSTLQTERCDTGEYLMYFAVDIPEKMREFGRACARYALEQAAEKAEVNFDDGGYASVWQESILNAFDVEEIR
jgi:hypothetical protein